MRLVVLLPLLALKSVSSRDDSSGGGDKKAIKERYDMWQRLHSIVLSKRYVFVGGLQRTGTTLVGGCLGDADTYTGLENDNLGPGAYEAMRPWTIQNFSRTEYEGTVKTGGTEGKFVQSVYPYTFLVGDFVVNNHSIDEHHFNEKTVLATRVKGLELFRQWAPFWDLDQQYLVEKTPENLMMSRALATMFGPTRTHFIFTMRHPLVWSLAIDKWVVKWARNAPHTHAFQVRQRVAFWLQMFQRLEVDIAHLPSATLGVCVSPFVSQA